MAGSSQRIRTDTQNLQAVAAQAAGEIRDICSALEQMSQKVSSTSSYWKGDAGDSIRKRFLEQKKTADEIMKRIGQQPSILEATAANYADAESKNAEQPMSLAGDVIV